ncbi:MAG: Na+/galactose cotransporter [Terracidiphilus sp.]
MPNLAPADWLILLINGFFMLTAGFSLKQAMTGSREYMQAGRKLPAWLCGVAMLGASLGSQEVLGMGAAGAQYGLASVGFFALGSIPAMLLAALVLVPVYYGGSSGTGTAGAAPRSIPEYLGLRFDQKTRALNACLFAAMAAFSAGIALYAMARVFAALHIFDRVANAAHLPPSGIPLLAIALPAAVVLTYVLLGGLAAAMYNQALQFCVMVAGLLPVVLLGLKKDGGWGGLKAAIPANFLHEWSGAAHAGSSPMGIGAIGLALGAGLVLGGGAWCADFRLLQMAMAAKDVQSARRAPLIAAAVRVFVPFLLILPGLIAIALPTPRTTVLIHNENGTIYHDIAVVPPAVEAGQGLVPAKADASTGKPVKGADGRAVLDYAMATPNVLVQFLPIGMLGLGLAALLACLMGGVAASLTAFSTVFACDIYQAFLAKDASDQRMLAVGRWAAAGGMMLAIGAACAAMRFNSTMDAMMLVFAVVNAPLFAALLLGALWKRATGHGAFAGLIAGAVAALLHHGLALPRGAQPGIHGGWIAVLHHPSSQMALDLGTAAFAFCVSLIVTAAVSAFTSARPEPELMGLVHSLAEQPPANAAWWKRPEALAGAILLAAIAVNLILI